MKNRIAAEKGNPGRISVWRASKMLSPAGPIYVVVTFWEKNRTAPAFFPHVFQLSKPQLHSLYDIFAPKWGMLGAQESESRIFSGGPKN